jgi:hypothetical protein
VLILFFDPAAVECCAGLDPIGSQQVSLGSVRQLRKIRKRLSFLIAVVFKIVLRQIVDSIITQPLSAASIFSSVFALLPAEP